MATITATITTEELTRSRISLGVFLLSRSRGLTGSGQTRFISHKAIMVLIAKAKADRAGKAPLVPEPILQLAPYRVH